MVFPIIAQSRDRKRDFCTPLDRAHQDEENGISLSRIACKMAQIRGGAKFAPPPLYVRVTRIDLYVRVLM